MEMEEEEEEKVIDDLNLILTKEIVGVGYENYYIGKKKGISTKFMVKEYNSDVINSKLNTFINEEIFIVKDLNHPNILKFIELKNVMGNIYIVTDYYNGGNLMKALKIYKKMNNKIFSEEIVQYIMRQIIEGMKYLHNKKIIHRDIKLQNIMINYEEEDDRINNNIMKGRIKIIGFALARYLQKGELNNAFVGTPIYMDPCLLNSSKEKEYWYNEKIDIWSLGAIFYELLTGKPLFKAKNREDLEEKSFKGDYFVPITLSKETVSFLNCMLQYDPTKRLSIDKLYNHKFLRKNINEFHKIDLSELNNIKIIDNSKILINSKDNELISAYFGTNE